ncbi:hypothetical protein ACFLVF_02560 [Chloroflexota bacterium]
MDVVLRSIAIIIELALLAGIAYCFLQGVKLAVTDMGAGTRYYRALTMAVAMIFTIVVVFFIAHLTTFYPPV